MRCWHCGHPEMDRQDGYDICTADFQWPNATYLCFECGFSFIWVLRQPIIILHDPPAEFWPLAASGTLSSRPEPDPNAEE